jgi:hypothetical protein
MHLRTPRLLPLASLLLAALVGCTGTVEPVSPASGQTISVQVSPAQIQVAPQSAVTFAAVVTGTANTAVSWGVQEVGGGTVDASGLYTAPVSAGTFHVTATSVADPSKQGTATVTVTAAPPPPPPPPPPPVTLSVSPTDGSVNACKTLQFTATVTGSTDTSVTWTVQEGAAGGSITAGGLYTAPSGPGTYHVVATSVADPSKSVVAAVTVSEVILAVTISPQTITVAAGGTAQFTATITNTCGTFSTTSTIAAAADGKVTVN